MITTRSRRFRRHSSTSREGAFFKKQNNEQSFFGNSEHDTFFQPAATIQRKCEKCEEESSKIHSAADKKEEDKKLQREPEKKEEEKLHKKESSSSNAVAVNTTANYVSSLSGKGQPLPKQQQYFFGSRMGYNFNNVKVHTDKDAAQSAKEVNAKAYTYGNNVVFNEGQYNTDSGEGKKLLAHELTHVMQNNIIPSRKAGENKLNRSCAEGRALHWGCDTTCSLFGFIDNDNPYVNKDGDKGEAKCCNKWPPYVESYARTNLSLNGAASCRPDKRKKIAKVKHGKNEVNVACTDTIPGDRPQLIELSFEAAKDLYGGKPQNANVKVCYVADISDSNLCYSEMPNPRNPDMSQCVEKRCFPQNPFVKCSNYGWS